MNPEEMKNLIALLGLGNPNMSNFSNINMPTQKIDFTNMSAVEKLKNLPSLLQSKGIDPLMTGMTLLNAGGYSDQKQTPLQPITTALAGGRQAFQQNQQMQQQNLLNNLRLGTSLTSLKDATNNNSIKAIFSNPDLTIDEKMQKASAIDPLITGKYVKAITDSTQNRSIINAYSNTGSNPYSQTLLGLKDTALAVGVEPGQLAGLNNLITGVDKGTIDLNNPMQSNFAQGVINSTNTLIENVKKAKITEEKNQGTGEEAKALGYLVRMQDATKTINSFVTDMQGKPLVIDGKKVTYADVASKPELDAAFVSLFTETGANYVRSSARQIYEQAMRNWVTANLRQESGAAIPESELESEYKKFFPQIGDKPETIRQKAKARKVTEETMRLKAGKAVKRMPTQNPTNTNNSQINISEQDVREELERRRRNR